MNKGYTLLFSILITSLVISIAVSVLNIARKEVLLSSAARESFAAVYAADGALDCAILNNNSPTDFFNPLKWGGSGSQKNISCAGNTWKVTKTGNGGNNTPHLFTFYISVDGSITGDPQSPCAKVEVRHWINNPSRKTIEARGYNVGWNNTSKDCSISIPNKVERAFRYSYNL